MKTQALKGMRDLLPNEQTLRDYIQGKILETYRASGFERISTPMLEDMENLDKSDGGDNLNLIFKVLKRGDKLTVLNSQAYGEWKPDFPGQMEFGVTCGMPVLHTYIAKCAWCDAWAKHGLTEYGKYYCCNIDNAWFQGFNPEFTCTQLNPPMSWGGDCCRFSWGEGLTHKQIKALNKKKKSLGNACIKDFTFHTAHILHTVGDVLMEELDNDGAMAVSLAKSDYSDMFGKDALDCLDGIF